MSQASRERSAPALTRRLLQMIWSLPAALGAAGCAHSPSFNVLGSYFPGWLACLIIGVLAAVLAHVLLSRRDWERRIAALPLFYLSFTLAVACVCWLLAFE